MAMLDSDRMLDNAATASQHRPLVDDETLRSCIVLNVIEPMQVEINRLKALAVKAITLAMHGCYSNGVMDPTGTIDEGDVMAVRCLAELEKEAAALGIVLPGKAEPPDEGKAGIPRGEVDPY